MSSHGCTILHWKNTTFYCWLINIVNIQADHQNRQFQAFFFFICRESLYHVSSFRTASTIITTNFNNNIDTELKLLIIRRACFKHAQLSQSKMHKLSHSGEEMHLWAKQTQCIHTYFLVNTQTSAWQPTIKRKRGFILVNKQHPAVILSAQWEQCCGLIPLWSDEMKTAEMRHRGREVGWRKERRGEMFGAQQ